eukprot:TRINITY_DN36225_c0_g1_i1.p1 TRINITY_DN36225_c0_g1~~TRINITY_DN36225_c0_g1_i1.p1  ORF type:complete len:277 (+),score=53.07 TRINITY_DN36225_c0_g1_i1:75-905(+)
MEYVGEAAEVDDEAYFEAAAGREPPQSARGRLQTTAGKADKDDELLEQLLAAQNGDEQVYYTYPSPEKLSNMPASPKFSMGARFKQDSISAAGRKAAVPGPGSYYETQPDRLAKYKRTPQFSFGSATRQSKKQSRIPGPGAYVHKPTIGQGPTYSCAPRRMEATARGKVPPGPGAHDLPTYLGKAPRHSMLPRRPQTTGAEIPGPGDYDDRDKRVVSKASPRWGFGTSLQRPRDVGELADSTPGPGAYRHYDARRAGPGFSMRSRTNCEKMRMAKF